MKWKQISKYAIECGKWRISKAYLDGCTMYALHMNGGEAVKFSEDVEDLKEFAEAEDEKAHKTQNQTVANLATEERGDGY